MLTFPTNSEGLEKTGQKTNWFTCVFLWKLNSISSSSLQRLFIGCWNVSTMSTKRNLYGKTAGITFCWFCCASSREEKVKSGDQRFSDQIKRIHLRPGEEIMDTKMRQIQQIWRNTLDYSVALNLNNLEVHFLAQLTLRVTVEQQLKTK